MAARASCISAQGQIAKNLESTLNLLKVISEEPWMLPEDIPYQRKPNAWTITTRFGAIDNTDS